MHRVTCFGISLRTENFPPKAEVNNPHKKQTPAGSNVRPNSKRLKSQVDLHLVCWVEHAAGVPILSASEHHLNGNWVQLLTKVNNGNQERGTYLALLRAGGSFLILLLVKNKTAKGLLFQGPGRSQIHCHPGIQTHQFPLNKSGKLQAHHVEVYSILLDKA